MRRERKRWGVARTAVWLGAAFAVGAIPMGRLVTRAVAGEELEDLGDHKLGSSNVARSVGAKAGAAVLALDAGKAYLPATVARLAGAGPNTVAALAITSMAGHIVVGKGRGAACALGGGFAFDPPTLAIASGMLVAGAVVHRHAESVAVTAVALPLVAGAVHRRPGPALRALALISVLLGVRLRGGVPGAWPASAAVWRMRFWLDRDG